MPRGKREQADQIILKLREAELELSRGKPCPRQPRAPPAHSLACNASRGAPQEPMTSASTEPIPAGSTSGTGATLRAVVACMPRVHRRGNRCTTTSRAR